MAIVVKSRDWVWRRSQWGATLCPQSEDGGAQQWASYLVITASISDCTVPGGGTAARPWHCGATELRAVRCLYLRPCRSHGPTDSPSLFPSWEATVAEDRFFANSCSFLSIALFVRAPRRPPPPRRSTSPSAFSIFLSHRISCFSSFHLANELKKPFNIEVPSVVEYLGL